MAGRERGDTPHAPRDKLEDKIARLDEDQRKRYDAQVDIAIQRNGEAGLDYRTALADTLLQKFSPQIEARQVRDLNRQEDARIRQYEQSLGEPTRPGRVQTRFSIPAAGLASSTQEIRPVQVQHREAEGQAKVAPDPMQGVEPHAPPRDYARLALAHEHIARQTRSREPSKDSATQPQAPDHLAVPDLQKLAERNEGLRRDLNIVPTRAEMIERAELTRAHELDRQVMNRKFEHEPAGPLRDKAEALMNRQHFAEQVGVGAKWIARELKARGLPDWDKHQKDARSAFATARDALDERQRTGGLSRGTEADRPQIRDDAQQAPHDGKTLSSDERANAPAEIRSAEHRERQSAGQAAPGAGKEVTQPRDVRSPGRNPGGGGRSR